MTPEQRTHAIVHNAADRALSSRGYWVPLGVRSAITEAVLAALVEHGYAIVSVAPAQPSGTPQDSQTSGDGMRGPLAPPEASTGLSDVHMETADRNGTRRITFPDATPGERTAIMRAVELDDLRTELEAARIGQRRAKEAEAALSRVVKLAHDLAADQLVAADNIAAAILNLDQRDLHPGDAIAALTKENHRDA